MSGSPSSPVTSLMISAPSSTARAATTAFDVSIDTGRPDSPTSRRTTSATRRSSSAAETGSENGLVLSPPTSSRSAPASVSARPWATAASTSACRPPSEKLSGVTLTIPITSGRRRLPPGCKTSSRRVRSCQWVGKGKPSMPSIIPLPLPRHVESSRPVGSTIRGHARPADYRAYPIVDTVRRGSALPSPIAGRSLRASCLRLPPTPPAGAWAPLTDASASPVKQNPLPVVPSTRAPP